MTDNQSKVLAQLRRVVKGKQGSDNLAGIHIILLNDDLPAEERKLWGSIRDHLLQAAKLVGQLEGTIERSGQ